MSSEEQLKCPKCGQVIEQTAAGLISVCPNPECRADLTELAMR